MLKYTVYTVLGGENVGRFSIRPHIETNEWTSAYRPIRHIYRGKKLSLKVAFRTNFVSTEDNSIQ
jgi:hypothetical protein